MIWTVATIFLAMRRGSTNLLLAPQVARKREDPGQPLFAYTRLKSS
jgi:hypothetical protein